MVVEVAVAVFKEGGGRGSGSGVVVCGERHKVQHYLQARAAWEVC